MTRLIATTVAMLTALALLSACTKQPAPAAAPAAATSAADDESELTGGDKVRPGAVMPENNEGTAPPVEGAPPPAQETSETPPAT